MCARTYKSVSVVFQFYCIYLPIRFIATCIWRVLFVSGTVCLCEANNKGEFGHVCVCLCVSGPVRHFSQAPKNVGDSHCLSYSISAGVLAGPNAEPP